MLYPTCLKLQLLRLTGLVTLELSLGQADPILGALSLTPFGKCSPEQCSRVDDTPHEDEEPEVGAEWDDAHVYDILLEDLHRCDFPRVHVNGSASKALEACKEPGNDCLGLGTDWAEHPWVFTRVNDNLHLRRNGPRSCGKAGMLRRHGDRQVVLSNAITHSHGRNYKSLTQYMSEDMVPPTTQEELLAMNASDTWYLCGDNFWDEILDAYDRPKLLGGERGAVAFGLGRTASGVPLHRHGAAFLETVYGTKRWFVGAPGTDLRFDPRKSTFHWFHMHQTRGTWPHDVLFCSQQPGEVLYLPDDWWHATLNVGEVLFYLDFLEAKINFTRNGKQLDLDL